MNKTSPRYSTNSITSCLSSFSFGGVSERSVKSRTLEGIFNVDGHTHDVMLYEKSLIWTKVTAELPGGEEPPIDTYEVDLVKCCIGLRIRKIKRLRTNKAVIAGFNLSLINWQSKTETTVTFNNDDPQMIEHWSNRIMRIISKRPFSRFKSAKVFIENPDHESISSILATLKSTGLKIDKSPLSSFKCLERNQLAILIGSEKFFQHAIEYALPRSSLAFVPTHQSGLAQHLYGVGEPRLALIKLVFGKIETSCAQVIRFKHLDGTVVQRKTIQLRIEPSTITNGSFCVDGKVTIDDNVMLTSSKKTHYMRITSTFESKEKPFRVKIKSSSNNQLISRAMITCLPETVATSLSSNLDSSSFTANEFNLKLINFTGDYRVRLGPIDYERTSDLRSIQITGDCDINFIHFTHS